MFQFAARRIKTEIYRTVILSVVLYGCETWSFTMSEERRLRVVESRVLRGVERRDDRGVEKST